MGLAVADQKIHRICPEGKTKHFLLIFNKTQPLSGPRVSKIAADFFFIFFLFAVHMRDFNLKPIIQLPIHQCKHSGNI